jgi:hypothetical protein
LGQGQALWESEKFIRANVTGGGFFRAPPFCYACSGATSYATSGTEQGSGSLVFGSAQSGV